MPNKDNKSLRAALRLLPWMAVVLAAPLGAQVARPAPGALMQAPLPGTPLLRPCESVTTDTPLQLSLGKSRVVRLPFAAARLVVGGSAGSRAGRPAPVSETGPGAAAQRQEHRPASEWDGVAETDITLISPTELYLLGRRPGSMNVVVQAADGRCLVKDIFVAVDPDTLQGKLQELIPEETGIRVRSAENAIVLTGAVSDLVRLDQVLSVAGAYGDGKKVINLLRVNAPQQVMLEVKIAEVSKNLLDRFGLDYSRILRSGPTFSVFSGLFGANPFGVGSIQPRPNAQGDFTVPGSFPGFDLINSSNSSSRFILDAHKQDGIIRVLAEPNIMAISGQTASFLSGGKIFIPVAQSRELGGTTITLEEKEFGVGLKFTPTVLDGTRINLKFVSEASELSQTGSPFTAFNGVTAILPSMATRRVDTTVQLNDGQSFVVAGLIKNNINGAISKLPGLGEVPVMGALFRSTEFQNDQTELMFVVTPRLVKPVNGRVTLPTDNHVPPTRTEVILQGTGEGPQPAPAPAPQPAPAQ